MQWVNPRKMSSQDYRCPSQGLNRILPEYESGAFPLGQPLRLLEMRTLKISPSTSNGHFSSIRYFRHQPDRGYPKRKYHLRYICVDGAVTLK
jgi:hypothetical protein